MLKKLLMIFIFIFFFVYQAATDLLVHQKQLTVGIPQGGHEEVITRQVLQNKYLLPYRFPILSVQLNTSVIVVPYQSHTYLLRVVASSVQGKWGNRNTRTRAKVGFAWKLDARVVVS